MRERERQLIAVVIALDQGEIFADVCDSKYAFENVVFQSHVTRLPSHRLFEEDVMLGHDPFDPSLAPEIVVHALTLQKEFICISLQIPLLGKEVDEKVRVSACLIDFARCGLIWIPCRCI